MSAERQSRRYIMASSTSTSGKRTKTGRETTARKTANDVFEADVTRVAKLKFQDVTNDNFDNVKKTARNKPTSIKVSAQLSADGWKISPRGVTRTLTTNIQLVPLSDVCDLLDVGDCLLMCVYRLSPIVRNKAVEYAVYRCPTMATVRSFVACFRRLRPGTRPNSDVTSPGASVGTTTAASSLEERLQLTDEFCPEELSDTESMCSQAQSVNPLHVPALRTARCNKFEDALRGKRSYLVDKMEPSDAVLNLLQDTDVLTQKQVSDIKSVQNQRNERNERLLDLLSIRPDDRFTRFIVTLLKTGQKEIAEFVAGDEFNAICDANPEWCEPQQQADELQRASFSSSGSSMRNRQDSFQSSFRSAVSVDLQQSMNDTCTLRTDIGSCELRRRRPTMSSVTVEPAPAHDDGSVATQTSIEFNRQDEGQLPRQGPPSPVEQAARSSGHHLSIVELFCCCFPIFRLSFDQ